MGIWKYGAEPTDPTTPAARTLVDGSTADGGHLVPDVEGLAIVYQPGGTGYLLASAQAASDSLNNYAVYERQGANAFIRTFRVVNGPATDGCGRTDGIDAVAANLGPAFPQGMFVCQDNNNGAPGTSGNQNFKFVPLERVVGLSATVPTISFVGQAMSNVNALAHTVRVPSGVLPGDGLLLFFSSNTTASMSAPTGAGAWQPLDTVVSSSAVTRVWRRVAGSTDAGSNVRVDVSSISKGNLVVVAYRGTSATDPVASFARAGDASARPATRRRSHRWRRPAPGPCPTGCTRTRRRPPSRHRPA